tara:strand:- start:3227 stop:3739 length:513 start_codon:yes stop_codon:yes gene_type:complete
LAAGKGGGSMTRPNLIAGLIWTTMKDCEQLFAANELEQMIQWPDRLWLAVGEVHPEGTDEHRLVFDAICGAIETWENNAADWTTIDAMRCPVFLLKTAVQYAVDAEAKGYGNEAQAAMQAYELMSSMGYDVEQDAHVTEWSLTGAKATGAEKLAYCLPRALRFLGLSVAA